MNTRIKKGALWGWRLAGLLTLLFTLTAAGKIIGVQPLSEIFERFGLKDNMFLIGMGELASAWLFLIPRTGPLGLLLMSSYLGGAIATHLQQGQTVAVPAVLLLLVWVSAYLRHPEVLQSFRSVNNNLVDNRGAL